LPKTCENHIFVDLLGIIQNASFFANDLSTIQNTTSIVEFMNRVARNRQEVARDESLSPKRVGSRTKIQQLPGVFFVFDVAFVGEADSGA